MRYLGLLQDGQPVNVEVVEDVLAAARKRPVQPLPDTKVQLRGCLCLNSVVDQEEEERRDSDRAICSASMLHQADIAVSCS